MMPDFDVCSFFLSEFDGIVVFFLYFDKLPLMTGPAVFCSEMETCLLNKQLTYPPTWQLSSYTHFLNNMVSLKLRMICSDRISNQFMAT